MRSLGGLARWSVAVLAGAPGTVTAFVVLGTLPALVDPSGGLAAAFGYVHRLAVWYAVGLAVLAAAAASEGGGGGFPARAGRAGLRLVALLPYAVALAAGNAAAGWLLARTPLPPRAGALAVAAVVPLAVAPFGLAPVATVVERAGLLPALRTSVGAVTAHPRRAAGLLLVYVGLTGGAVAVRALGALSGGALAVGLAEALGGFLGTVVLAPLAVMVTGFYLDARGRRDGDASPADG